MANAATIAANRNSEGGPGQAPEDAAPAPFIRGARERTEPFDDRTHTIAASATQVGPIDVAPFGFFRNVVILVEATASGNAADVAFAEDGPFNALDQLTLTDVNGNPLFNLGGYAAYLANKYGGYSPLGDARRSPVFSTTEGTDAAGGSFAFLLRIPVEISGRDALGALSNQNAGQTYKVSYTVAPGSTIYDTEPTDLPDVRVRMWLEAWSQPQPADLFGRPISQMPPAHGTLQFWTEFTANIESGLQTIRAPRVGNQLRLLLAVFRTSAGARSTTDLPDPVQLRIDGNQLDNVGRDVLRHRIAERYGYDGTVDAAGGLDTGVIGWSWAHDLDGVVGWEMRDLYLPTTQATRLEVEGSFDAAGTLRIITNDIAAAGQITG